MMDFLARCFELDQSSWMVLTILALAGYVLLSQMLGEHGPAILGTPMLVLCAAVGNTAVADLGVVAAGDKIMNMVVGMSAGMMLGGVIVVVVLWSWNAIMAR